MGHPVNLGHLGKPSTAPTVIWDSLEDYGLGHDRFFAGNNRILFCRVLFTSFPLCPTRVPAPMTFQLLRSHPEFQEPEPQNQGDIIYVSRKDSAIRRISNEDEVLPHIVEKYGIRPVQLTGMPFREQIKVFRNASLVIGPHGAGLANALFSNRAGIMELSQSAWHPSLWYVSAARDLPHSVVLAASEYHDRSAIISNPSWRRGSYPSLLRMDPRDVTNALDAVLASGL